MWSPHVEDIKAAACGIAIKSSADATEDHESKQAVHQEDEVKSSASPSQEDLMFSELQRHCCALERDGDHGPLIPLRLQLVTFTKHHYGRTSLQYAEAQSALAKSYAQAGEQLRAIQCGLKSRAVLEDLLRIHASSSTIQKPTAEFCSRRLDLLGIDVHATLGHAYAALEHRHDAISCLQFVCSALETLHQQHSHLQITPSSVPAHQPFSPVSGPPLVVHLSSLARLLQAERRWDDAEQVLIRMWQHVEQTTGLDSVEMLPVQVQLSKFYFESLNTLMNEMTAADHALQAVSIADTLCSGSTCPASLQLQAADAYIIHARACQKQGRFEDAMSSLKKASSLSVWRDGLGSLRSATDHSPPVEVKQACSRGAISEDGECKSTSFSQRIALLWDLRELHVTVCLQLGCFDDAATLMQQLTALWEQLHPAASRATFQEQLTFGVALKRLGEMQLLTQQRPKAVLTLQRASLVLHRICYRSMQSHRAATPAFLRGRHEKPAAPAPAAAMTAPSYLLQPATRHAAACVRVRPSSAQTMRPQRSHGHPPSRPDTAMATHRGVAVPKSARSHRSGATAPLFGQSSGKPATHESTPTRAREVIAVVDEAALQVVSAARIAASAVDKLIQQLS